HLLGMIDDVLDLSKIEAGQITLSPASIFMSQVLDDVLQKIKPEIAEKKLSLQVSISPDEPLVRADRHYLTQIISNLLKNAVKFTHEGSIHINVLSTTFSGGSSRHIKPPMSIYVPEGDWVTLRVTDTGIGIKPEDQELIFESFRQVDSSTVREYGGPGLGLAISRRLVEMHEGYIWVDSDLGVGSSFNVLLPTVKLGLVDDLNIEAVHRDQRPLVLVIDDGPADRQLLQDYLDAADYQVVCTANPGAAQEIVRTLQPDLVITDVVMPEVSGWDVLRGLKADPQTAHIPVIVISILDQPKRGYDLGAADFLVKPVDRETLRAQVQRALGN
ncbi:MAG: ATP-binding protein, partial [Chloroflexota bacterium]